MMLRNKPICKLYAFGLALLFTVALAGCGGGGGSKKAMDTDPDTGMPPATTLTPEQMCAAENGRFEADGSCTSAEVVTAEAGTKEDAIVAELDGNDGPGGTGITTDHAITVEHDGTSAAVTIAVAGAATDDPKFEDQMAGLDAGRSMHVRTMEADNDGNVVREIMIVSTDIGAPMPTKFGADGTKVELTVRKDGENVDEANDKLADSMTVTAGADDANLPKIMAAGFSAATGGSFSVTHSFQPAADDADDTTEGAQPRDAAEVMGTFDGAMGTYTCSDTTATNTCTATVDDEGDVTAISSNWIFTPASVAAGGTIDVPDPDYLYYGFWLKNTTDEDGVLTYDEVETFAWSSLPLASNTVEGSASYKGGAVGVYVRNVYVPSTTGGEKELDYATSGHFKADVNIDAYFGGGDVAANKQNTIDGTIDNFNLQYGEDASGWGVKVSADISGANLTNGEAEGGGAGEGSITGSFHGDDSKDVDGTDTPIGHKVLVGEFNASFTNGSVAGGFGARRE